jgi:type I restriction enzyme S subunit
VKLAPYERYKQSGIQWLGNVPEHWRVKRLRHVLARNDGGVWGTEDDPDGTVVLRSTEQAVGGGWQIDEPARRRLSVEEKPYARLAAGDLLITKSSGSALHIGKTSLVTKEVEALNAGFSNFMQRLRFGNALSPRIGAYLLNSPVGRQQLVYQSNTTTGLANLNGSMLANVVFADAPSNEQRAIADFLDRETARLDMLAGKKRELIEKLKEKRTALISRTVTRGLPAEAAAKAGLNPRPKLKSSGSEWLGDVPEHWELLQLRRRITLQRGVDITKDEQNEGNVPVVSSGGISSYHDHALVRGPGVIVGRKGTAGAVYYIEEDFWPHDTTLYVREYRGSSPRYVFYKLLSMNLQSYDTGSANPTVNRNIVHPEVVSWPSPTEQQAIVDYLDCETAKIDKMMEKVEAAIEKLQEYRTALITAAVTGKIDVRAVDR